MLELRLVMDGRTVAEAEISDDLLDVKQYSQVAVRFTPVEGAELPPDVRVDIAYVDDSQIEHYRKRTR
jgi:hypothetical protein